MRKKDEDVTVYGTLFSWINMQSALRTIKNPAKLTVKAGFCH